MIDAMLVQAPPDRRIPILIVGDAPTRPTGLARIARDIAELLRRDGEAGILNVRVAQLGLYYDGRRCNWHVYPIKDEESWGQGDIGAAWEDWSSAHGGPGVIFSCWDPGRCPAIVQGMSQAPLGRPDESAYGRLTAAGKAWPQLWGYFAVDAHNPHGALGGMVPETLALYQRVLAYGIYGAEVLEKTTGKPVKWLPHGIDLDVFKPGGELPEAYENLPEWVAQPEMVTVGVVATNTPRKDFGALFAALEGVDCRLWVHTDKVVTNAWSIPELAELFGRNHPGRLVVTKDLDDEQMARWYSLCDATVAPGLGEGFGYPIVESLACGTPVVHVHFAGGSQYVPVADWRVPPAAERTEGPYAMIRPVVKPSDIREALRAAVTWKRRNRAEVEGYCRGSVQALDWRNLWPYWREWFREGLKHLEGDESQEQPRTSLSLVED